MKINGIGDGGNSYRIKKVSDSSPGSRAEKSTTGGSQDRLELSPDAKRIASLAQAANRLPEIRQERVAELTKAIRQGVYEVDSRALARSIMEFEDALG